MPFRLHPKLVRLCIAMIPLGSAACGHAEGFDSAPPDATATAMPTGTTSVSPTATGGGGPGTGVGGTPSTAADGAGGSGVTDGTTPADTIADMTTDFPSCSAPTPDPGLLDPGAGVIRPPTCDDTLEFGATRVELADPLPGQTLTTLVGDWNGDGHLDLVGATSAGVRVLLGNGDGTFASRVDSPMTLHIPWDIQTADLNRDGALDLVIVPYGYDMVNVLFGDGAGGFTCGATYTTGALPVGSAVDDFNADGFQDIAILNQNAGTVQVFLGNADGTFRRGASFSVGPTPSAITAGDLDGDYVAELMVALWNDQSVNVYTGVGDGRFRNGGEFVSGHLPSFAAEGTDVNADGYLDLIVSNGCTPSDDPSISVLLGTGYGGFVEPDVYPSANCVGHVSIGDVDGDGLVDLLGRGGLLFGNGDGSFLPENTRLASGGSLGLFDWNEDGKLDIAQTYDNTVYLALGNGDGTFGTLVKSDLDLTSDGQSVDMFVLADLNDDGTLDSALGTFDSVIVAVGVGDGTFTFQGEYPTGPALNDIDAADLNGDDRMDVVTTSWDSSKVSVLLSTVDGSFNVTEYTTEANPVRFAIADVDANQTPDLVVTSSSGVGVLLGRGDGSFVAEASYPVPESPGTVFLGDVNADGALDALFGHGTTGEPSVLFGQGDGSFAPASSLGTTGGDLVGVADLNRDGALDLVTRLPHAIAVALGNGDGTFGAADAVYPEPFELWHGEVGVADLDADGNPDLLLADVILRGVGDGSFRCAERHAIQFERSGDVNGDGLVDLASTSAHGITVALNASE